MMRFKEKELNDYLEKLKKNNTIELEFEKNIDGKIILENATVEYDSKNGFINIESKNGKFKINTTLVYRYIYENEIIYIFLDDLILKLRNK